jgi:hypothetical protein
MDNRYKMYYIGANKQGIQKKKKKKKTSTHAALWFGLTSSSFGSGLLPAGMGIQVVWLLNMPLWDSSLESAGNTLAVAIRSGCDGASSGGCLFISINRVRHNSAGIDA